MCLSPAVESLHQVDQVEDVERLGYISFSSYLLRPTTRILGGGHHKNRHGDTALLQYAGKVPSVAILEAQPEDGDKAAQFAQTLLRRRPRDRKTFRLLV